MAPEPAATTPAEQVARQRDEARPGSSRALTAVATVLVVAVLGGAALVVTRTAVNPEPPPAVTPTAAAAEPPPDEQRAAQRIEATTAVLAQRARAVLAGDRTAFLASVDPSMPHFAAAQRELVRRLADVPLAGWTYRVLGEGPGLPAEVATALPKGAGIVRVRLTYRLDGTTTDTDREQYLTVVPRGGRWLLAGDTHAEPAGFATQRDLWDLGPVLAVPGRRSLVVAHPRAAGMPALRRLAGEADRAVVDVDRVWEGEWSRRPVVLLPATQEDMAAVIGSDGRGLAQIAAVTTGAFEEGLSRGDRIVVNPAAFATLGAAGRRVVLSHEMTHVATRATGVNPVPIWLSEGFADYVAYAATSLAVGVVASDVLDAVRDGRVPSDLPQDADFDAGEGDVAAAYEGAWLACLMVARRYGEDRLVQLYEAVADSAGPGWPEETRDVLGISTRQLVRQWRTYLITLAQR